MEQYMTEAQSTAIFRAERTDLLAAGADTASGLLGADTAGASLLLMCRRQSSSYLV